MAVSTRHLRKKKLRNITTNENEDNFVMDDVDVEPNMRQPSNPEMHKSNTVFKALHDSNSMFSRFLLIRSDDRLGIPGAFACSLALEPREIRNERVISEYL